MEMLRAGADWNMTRLEQERRQRGWTQTTVAFYAGLTQALISSFERRRLVPSPERAARIARVLGIPPESLLDEVPEPKSDMADFLERVLRAEPEIDDYDHLTKLRGKRR